MSEKQEDTSRENRDDLEYNDGLGDLLREKEHFEFSWVKTLASVLVIVIVLYIGVMILFKLAKSMVENPETTAPTTVVNDPHQELVDEILSTSSMNVQTPTQDMVPLAPTLPPVEDVQPKQLPVKKAPAVTETKPVKPIEKRDVTAKSVPAPQAAQAPVVEPSHNDRRLTGKRVSRSTTPRTPLPVPVAAPVQSYKPASKPVHTVKTVEKTVKKAAPVVSAAPAASSEQAYKVIAGSFITRDNAESLKKQLASKGIATYIWATTDNQHDTVYRVQVGSFKRKDVAQRLQSELNSKGVETYIQSN